MFSYSKSAEEHATPYRRKQGSKRDQTSEGFVILRFYNYQVPISEFEASSMNQTTPELLNSAFISLYTHM